MRIAQYLYSPILLGYFQINAADDRLKVIQKLNDKGGELIRLGLDIHKATYSGNINAEYSGRKG